METKTTTADTVTLHAFYSIQMDAQEHAIKQIMQLSIIKSCEDPAITKLLETFSYYKSEIIDIVKLFEDIIKSRRELYTTRDKEWNKFRLKDLLCFVEKIHSMFKQLRYATALAYSISSQLQLKTAMYYGRESVMKPHFTDYHVTRLTLEILASTLNSITLVMWETFKVYNLDTFFSDEYNSIGSAIFETGDYFEMHAKYFASVSWVITNGPTGEQINHNLYAKGE